MSNDHGITIITPGQTPSGTARAALSHAHDPVQSLYIHVPFCAHKCHYCDFYSFVDNRDRQGVFVTRLADELRTLALHTGQEPLRSIFVGGGTPSLLGLDGWEELLDTLHGHFNLAGLARPATDPETCEFTVECNPESTTPELAALLSARGVNRVSIGAQSFNTRHLKTLERWHDPDNVGRAVEIARAAGIDRQSVDLIVAIPGQTIEEVESDLDAALSLGTTHLSCYSLTYEPNTPMTTRLQRGEFEAIDEDLEAEMLEVVLERAREAGLDRYEVSNYAQPGHESRHNLAYWRHEQWLAAGPSASGHVWGEAGPDGGSHRWKNVPRLATYLESVSGYSPIVDHETPEAARALKERVMMGVRLREGIAWSPLLTLADSLAPGSGRSLHKVRDRWESQGMLTVVSDRLVLTDLGVLYTDAIAGELMDAIS